MEKFKKIFYGKIDTLLSNIKDEEKEKWYRKVDEITVKYLDSWQFLVHQAGCKCLSPQEISDELARCGYRNRQPIGARAVRERAEKGKDKIIKKLIEELDKYYSGGLRRVK